MFTSLTTDISSLQCSIIHNKELQIQRPGVVQTSTKFLSFFQVETIEDNAVPMHKALQR